MYRKELISIVLSVALITTSIPPRAAEASWFSDIFGGLFTFITAPIWIFCPDNPTFRKNNPFRQKEWEEEPVNKYNHPTRFPKNKTYDEIKDELQKEQDERFKKYQVELSSTIATLQGENQVLRSWVTNLASKLNQEELLEIITTVVTDNRHLLKGDKGDRGDDGKDGTSPSEEVLLGKLIDYIEANPEMFKGKDGTSVPINDILASELFNKIMERLKKEGVLFKRTHGPQPTPPPRTET
jgi:hypothetical protein